MKMRMPLVRIVTRRKARKRKRMSMMSMMERRRRVLIGSSVVRIGYAQQVLCSVLVVDLWEFVRFLS